jgi:hypothetical protein
MSESSGGLTLVPAAIGAAVGYVVLGLVGFFMHAAQAPGTSMSETFEAMTQGFKDMGAIGALVGFIAVVLLGVVRSGNVVGQLLDLSIVLGAFGFGYLGMTRRLPFTVEGIGGALDLGNGPIMVVGTVIAIVSIVSIRPIPVLQGFLYAGRGFLGGPIFFPVYAMSLWAGIAFFLGLGFVVFLVAGQIIGHLMDDFSFWLGWLVRLGFWTGMTLFVGGGAFVLRRVLSAPEPWRGRKLGLGLVAGLVVAFAGGSSLVGLAHAARDDVKTVQGAVTIHSDDPRCKTSGVYFLRAGVRTSHDISFVQCEGCDCSGPLNVRAMPGEDPTVFVRSGDLIQGGDLQMSTSLPDKGQADVPLKAAGVAGRLLLEPGPLWQHASGMPLSTAGRLVGNVQLNLNVGRAYGPALPPKVRVRLTTPHKSSVNVCAPSYSEPDCAASVHDDALRPGDVITVTAEEANCLLACTYVEREYVVSGVDRARGVFMKRAIRADVTIDVAGTTALPPASFPPALSVSAPSSSAPAPALSDKPASAPASLVILKPTSVSASSAMRRPPNDVHPAEHAFDGSLKTAWNEDAPGPGRGEWIEAKFASPRRIEQIRMTTGFLTKDLFAKNAHVKRLKLSLDGTVVQTIDVKADQKWLTIPSLDASATTVRFTVDDVYEGTTWQDLCISEIEIYGADAANAPKASAAPPSAMPANL